MSYSFATLVPYILTLEPGPCRIRAHHEKLTGARPARCKMLAVLPKISINTNMRVVGTNHGGHAPAKRLLGRLFRP